MLERKCRKIVKCCNKYFSDKDTISFFDLKSKLKNYSDKDLYMCCCRLKELNYIDSFEYSDDLSIAYFSPNYQLYNHSEYVRAQRLEFLRKSIIVPVVVALLTSILTVLLTDYLIPMIQSWLP